MSRQPRYSSFLGPSAVAVHYDCHVGGHSVFVKHNKSLNRTNRCDLEVTSIDYELTSEFLNFHYFLFFFLNDDVDLLNRIIDGFLNIVES